MWDLGIDGNTISSMGTGFSSMLTALAPLLTLLIGAVVAIVIIERVIAVFIKTDESKKIDDDDE